MPPIAATSIIADQNDHIYTCLNDSLTTIRVNFTKVTPPTNEVNETNFFTTLNMTDAEEEIIGNVNSTMTYSSRITNSMASAVTSFPFAIYFLGFLNYFSLSSLYVLLNFPIPKRVYNVLAMLYKEVN